MGGKRILTGVKPTGQPHLGNYVGAIRPALNLAEKTDDAFLFIADYHALNIIRDAKEMRNSSYDVAATWLALGLDKDKNVFYRQSDIAEIFEINVILTAMTPKGLMNRAHAYKASLDKNREDGKKDLDIGVNMGLYTYPILMASDILMAQTNIVPVGKDQVQHVEMARDIAGYFNKTFGDTFVLPEHKIEKQGSAIPGLDGRKMSKSYNNTIPLFLESKKRRKLIMKIITDSKLPEEPKDPNESTIYQLYTHFGIEGEIQEMREAFEKGGMGYGDAKQKLFEAIERELEEPTEKYHAFLEDKSKLDDILAEGAKKARIVAKETLSKAREAIGL